MVSILKNQLLKHLSRFTKNLSADKINLSTFKGEGELNNLELNEIVLTDLLELPSWLRLKSAWCNRVTFRIQWTQLKKVPIHFSLDEVNIIVETCDELRSTNAQSSVTTTIPGKYSFIHKIIDGITVSVNTVNIAFNSTAFAANVQISRILVESKTPKWTKADLKLTRLKDSLRGQILIFKELEWQNVKIEAKSTVDSSLTPLRLLTNQAKCRITIKKRLSDSFIIGSRLILILDDLLWVLTDSQLKAALYFVDSLTGLIQRATQMTRKVKAARKLEEIPRQTANLEQMAKQSKLDLNEISKIFSSWDVVETSYHFLSHQIVLHLCDDGPVRSSYPSLKDGGALQVTLQMFQIDYYPYHLVHLDRKHWAKYQESSMPHVQWQNQALNSFKTKLFDLIDKKTLHHTPLSRSTNCKVVREEKPEGGPLNESPQTKRQSINASNNVHDFSTQQFNTLMSSCTIIRLFDFTVFQVSTSGKKHALKEFITGDRDLLHLQSDSKIVHAEFTYFYYPNDIPFPVPAPQFYVVLNPIHIIFDVDSCLWFNTFALNLHQSLLESKKELSNTNLTYMDIKIEAILPKISFESGKDYLIQRDRPRSLTIQVTRAIITNVRSLEQSSRADLAKCVDSFHMGSLFFGSEFPSKPEDFYIVTEKFLDHISTKDNVRSLPKDLDISSIEQLLSQLYREFLWTEAKDIWCIQLDPAWAEFCGARASPKPVPFLDAVPITIWAHSNLDPNSTIKNPQLAGGNKHADIHAMAYIPNLVSIQLNHYQYLFLLRLAEDVAEMATFLSIDTNKIMKVDSNTSLIVGALIPQLEITFVMPSQCPGKESSGGDVESFVPESSSIADDILVEGSNITVWQTSTLSITSSPGYGDKMKKLTFNDDFVDSTSPQLPPAPILSNSTPPIEEKDRCKIQSAAPVSLPNNFNASFSSMKKGFSQFMTSIDTVLKPAIEDASDTISIRSDVSSDSENYVFLQLTQGGDQESQKLDDMFFVNEFSKPQFEVAVEVVDPCSTPTSTSDPSLTSSCKRKDLVYLSTFKLSRVEFIQQSIGYSSSIKLQVGNVSSDECSSIPWDEFQNKFSLRSRAWSENATNSSTSVQVKIRMDHDMILPSSRSMMEMDFANKDVLKKMFRDFLNIQINDVNLKVTTSTVVGLTDMVEDEVIPIPIPLQISLKNIVLHLIEDRPPANITSPGPIPLDINLHELYIIRSEDGIFNVIPYLPLKHAISSMSMHENHITDSHSLKQIKLENEELQRRLNAFERISEENRALRKSKEENDVLRSCLASSQDEVAKLLNEKSRLLDEIKKLKELNERGRQWVSKR